MQEENKNHSPKQQAKSQTLTAEHYYISEY